MSTKVLIESVRKSGLKVTSIRKNILQIFDLTKSPISAGDLLNKITANKTSVYRELETLTKEKFISPITLEDGIKRYELSSKVHHHHFICVKCKSILEFKISRELEKAESKQEKLFTSKKGLVVLNHNFEYMGLCQNCR